MITVIGAGGVGSYLLPCLCKTTKEVEIWDGDIFEEKNHERQIFDTVGENKADHLAKKYGVTGVASYVEPDSDLEGEIVLCCVDNDQTRLDVLEICDREDLICIIGANETYCSEAYVYLPEWKDGPLDPRVFYPELNEGNGRDPRQPPCNDDEAIADNPQLPLANMGAATLMLKLLEYYTDLYLQLPKENRGLSPHHYMMNRSATTTKSIGATLDESQGTGS